MKKILTYAICLLTALQIQAQSIDSSASKVEFKISNMGFRTVQGSIGGMQGDIHFNENNLAMSYFNVDVDPSSIDTDNEKRDEHLKNEDFFYVEKYIAVNFKSKEIRKSGDAYLALGTLSMHGMEKEIELPFTASREGDQIRFEGSMELVRADYQLGTEKYSGGFMVGKKVEVKIICVAKEN